MISEAIIDNLERAKEHELNVIGCLIQQPDLYFAHDSKIKPDHFYYEAHRKFLRWLIGKIEQDHQSVNIVTVAEDLVRHGIAIDEVANVPSPHTLPFYCDRVHMLHLNREIKRIGTELQSAEFNDLKEMQEKLASYQSQLDRLENEHLPASSRLKSAQEAGKELMQLISANTPDISLKTKLVDLDRLVKGFKPANLIVIGARPSVGKTALSVTFLNNFAEQGKRCLYLSFEQSTTEIMARLVANLAHVDSDLILEKDKDGDTVLNEEEIKKVSAAFSIIGEYPFFIHDEPLTVSEIKTMARSMKKREGLDCIIIDHLGEVTPADRRAPIREQISQVCQDLKQLAKQLDIPIILLAQLSRGVEQRNDKRPNMSDLRESGRIEEVSDVILMLYRDEYYNEDSDKKNILEINITKNRGGKVGKIETLFLKQYSKVLCLSVEE